MNDVVIISDIHLGSEVCQAKKLIQFLQSINNEIQSKKLIINGDLFDSWDFRKLKKSHWKVLSQIRSLSKSVHLIWINGNHDGPAEIISHLLGVEFLEEYEFKSGDKKFLVLHGDRFDNFISDYPLFTKLADNIYRWIQRIDKSFYLARLAKRSSKTFLRCSEQICNRAKSYALSKGFDEVVCSHVHHASTNPSVNGGVGYHNTGCWTELPCSFITVKNGEVGLHFYE